MRGVDDAIRDRQPHRCIAYQPERAAPPGARSVGLVVDALHEHEEVRVLGEDRIPATLGRCPPVSGGRPGTPGRRTVRLVVQVDTDDGGVGRVALCEHPPVGDPPRLRILRCVPELRLAARVRPVLVEDHVKTGALRRRDDVVHDLQRREPGE